MNSLLRTPAFVFVLAVAITSRMGGQQPSDDTIYYNGNFITEWSGHETVQAVAIRGTHFLAVGTLAEVSAAADKNARRVDLHGRTVLPGLEDSHTHPITSALSEKDGPLPVVKSIPEILAWVDKQAATTPPSQPILLPKLYSSRLVEHRYPTRQELDSVAPNRPAMTDNGYSSALNSAALKMIGVTRDTPQPANGKIIKDKNGEPTGLIIGAPQLLESLRKAKPTTHDDMVWGLKAMQKAYNAVGITSTIDRAEGPEGFRVYAELNTKHELTVRTYVTYLLDGKATPQELPKQIENIPLVTGTGDAWFRIGSLKVIADGGILLGTAFLREPYGDHTDVYGYHDPQYQGVMAVSKDYLNVMARTADRLGWQMTAHVTGGGSLDALLSAYQAANAEKPIAPLRFTVTHGNFPNAAAIRVAKALGVSFDVQPAWLYEDADAIKDVFGPERMKDFQPLRSLFDAGIVVAGGSDHMVGFDSRNAINPYNPFLGMWIAITRKTTGGIVIGPDQTVTREQALKMWTLNGAYLSFEEGVKGSIEPGKLADMVVISKDYLHCPVDEIKDIDALMTIVDGRVVYRDAAMSGS
jgi:hypothetical protein